MPITGGGGNIVDWGLLTALQGTNDWEQKRLDRTAELKYAQQLRDIAEAEKLKQQQAGNQLFNVFNEVNKLQVLPPDTEKIRIKNEELINPIKEGIKKYSGDVNMYLQSGGYNDLVKYSQDLQKSKEVSDALRRAKDYADFNKDLQSGKIIRPVFEDINGSKQKYNPEERINDFLDGKAQDFEYRGGFEPFQTDYRKSFSEVYGNPNRTPRNATRDDVFNMAMFEAKRKGLSKDDAEYYSNIVADEYDKGIQSGTLTPYLFKSDNPLDAQLKQSQIEKNRASTNLSNQRANKIASGGEDNPSAYWVKDLFEGGDKASFAVADLVNGTSGDGKVIDAEIVTENTTFLNNGSGAKPAENVSSGPQSIKIKVTKSTPTGQPIDKVYDLSNSEDVGELSAIHASKTSSKTYPSRSQEYQGVDKNASKSQGKTNQYTTSSGITFTVE